MHRVIVCSCGQTCWAPMMGKHRCPRCGEYLEDKKIGKDSPDEKVPPNGLKETESKTTAS